MKQLAVLVAAIPRGEQTIACPCSLGLYRGSSVASAG